jgi:lipopolysaccharide export system permease protein
MLPRFDRYLLSQLLQLFGFFSLVLVLIYWINRAVRLFDQLIANGQSALVFLEFSALTLPNVIRTVLPISAFVASVYVANRMSQESELVVVQATGYSPARLARPVAVFGLIVAMMLLVLGHLLTPLAGAQLSARQSEVSANMTARLLTEGQFIHPGDGYTFYVREIAPDGGLHDVFLADRSLDKQETIYTADSAFLEQAGPEETRLSLLDGMAQVKDLTTGRISTSSFTKFQIDLGSIVSGGGDGQIPLRNLPSTLLFGAPPEILAVTGESADAIRLELHNRTAQSLLAIVAALVGFAMLLNGSYSRFGLARQIVAAIFALIALKLIDNAAVAEADKTPEIWAYVYLAPLAGLILTVVLLWRAGKPALFLRRVQT